MRMKKFDNGTQAVWNVKEISFPKNGKMESKIKFLLNYAILAPSGHNSQPWKFKIEGNKLKILPDYERRRLAVDPEDRELFISLGCAVKNLEIAADYFGMIKNKSYEIDIKEGKVGVEFDFKNGTKESTDKELFKAIVERQTNRGEYEDRNISKDQLKRLIDGVGENGVRLKVFSEKKDKELLGNLVYSSNKVWFKSRDLVEELDGWLQDDVDGNGGLSTGMLNLYKIAVNLKYFLMKDSPELEEKASREKRYAEKAAAIVVVESEADGIENWIKSGEGYEELALKLTSMGLSHGFFNTIIELKTQREKLARMCGTKGRPQMILRVGYAVAKPEKSPRREVKEVLI